jgi:trehalose/maltose hydrolase-like predicted phosphorylase
VPNELPNWLVLEFRADGGEWFDACATDLLDFRQDGTTPEGIHLGAMADTVDIIQRCYTGLDVHGDVLDQPAAAR